MTLYLERETSSQVKMDIFALPIGSFDCEVLTNRALLDRFSFEESVQGLAPHATPMLVDGRKAHGEEFACPDVVAVVVSSVNGDIVTIDAGAGSPASWIAIGTMNARSLSAASTAKTISSGR